MKPQAEHYRTEGYLMPSETPAGTCLTFWILSARPDGFYDVMQKDIHPTCNIRMGIAVELTERQAVDLIRAIEKAAAEEGKLLAKTSTQYARVARDEMFSAAQPLLHHPAYMAAQRLENIKKNKSNKPNFKFK